ncbi:MAG: di-heme oxidoredictase family protein [Methylocella sp.]
MKKRSISLLAGAAAGTLSLGIACAGWADDETRAKDPGVRGGAPGAGTPIKGLSTLEAKYFNDGQAKFLTVDRAPDGLGPRFNLNQCAGCHVQPAVGGTSPTVNPQIAVSTLLGANNHVPLFISPTGAVTEARFKFQAVGAAGHSNVPDGGVHSLFVIAGRSDVPKGCSIKQEDFNDQFRNGNVSLRIPTPVFGGGLIGAIPDRTILANQAANASAKAALGISGFPNRSGNDGTITRFGWKAQNKSLLMFSGEAYNVEMGVSNDLFLQKRDETPGCQTTNTPNDSITASNNTDPEADDVELFAAFMNFLDQPVASTTVPGGATSIKNGMAAFTAVGCAMCHQPSLTTSSIAQSPALTNINANLFSDLLVHHMGPHLADDITQGLALGDEFRTAPLWGVGQRVFFLHDGRTNDLVQAILNHASAGNERYGPSEANAVIAKFSALPASSQQDVLNFLRSL